MVNLAFVPVELETRAYLIPASCVVEIVGPRRCVRIPRASAIVPGVFSWNGRAIPLLALDELLDVDGRRGRANSNEPGRRRILIVAVEGETLGVAVDGVREVVRLSQDMLRDPEALPGPYVSSEVERPSGLLQVLDLARVVHGILGETDAGHLGSSRDSLDAPTSFAGAGEWDGP